MECAKCIRIFHGRYRKGRKCHQPIALNICCSDLLPSLVIPICQRTTRISTTTGSTPKPKISTGAEDILSFEWQPCIVLNKIKSATTLETEAKTAEQEAIIEDMNVQNIKESPRASKKGRLTVAQIAVEMSAKPAKTNNIGRFVLAPNNQKQNKDRRPATGKSTKRGDTSHQLCNVGQLEKNTHYTIHCQKNITNKYLIKRLN